MQNEKEFDNVLKTFQIALEDKRTQENISSVQPLHEQVFFNYYFNPKFVSNPSENTLIHVNHKVLNLHDKKLRVSYINPVVNFDLEDMTKILHDLSQRDLITMIYSDKDARLESLGFEAVVEQQVCNIPSQVLPEFDVRGIVLDPPAHHLKEVFDTYSSYFTGFFERSVDDFNKMKRDTNALKGRIVGVADEDHMRGYIRCIQHSNYVEVLECCYDTSGTLLRLLSFVSKGTSRIIYYTNLNEKIHKILPGVKIENKVVMLARINDKELFERLFHIKIISSYSAFNAFSKPVLNTDRF